MSPTETRSDTSDEASTLVEQFADSEKRWEAFIALQDIGAEALPAAREGPHSDLWQVRR